MTDAIKDLRVSVRISNNQLKERREALGLSAPQFANRAGVSYGDYIRLENMKDSPFTSGRGKFGRVEPVAWRKLAVDIARAHSVVPEVLWPDSVQNMERVEAEVRVDAEEVAVMMLPRAASTPLALLAAHEDLSAIEGSLDILTPREREIVEARFGLGDTAESETYQTIADRYSVSRERVRQIEAKALRKLGQNAGLRQVANGG